MHSHLLGATAQRMPLIAAAVAVAATRAPQVYPFGEPRRDMKPRMA